MFKSLKFDTNNNERLSKAIQKELFRIGYRWTSQIDKKVANLEYRYIYADDDGLLSFSSDDVAARINFFNIAENSLTNLGDLYLMEPCKQESFNVNSLDYAVIMHEDKVTIGCQTIGLGDIKLIIAKFRDFYNM